MTCIEPIGAFVHLKILNAEVLQNFEPLVLQNLVEWRKRASVLQANAFKESYMLTPELGKLKGEQIEIQGRTCSLQEIVMSLSVMKIESATIEQTCSGPKLKGGNALVAFKAASVSHDGFSVVGYWNYNSRCLSGW